MVRRTLQFLAVLLLSVGLFFAGGHRHADDRTDDNSCAICVAGHHAGLLPVETAPAPSPLPEFAAQMAAPAGWTVNGRDLFRYSPKSSPPSRA